MYTIGVHLDEGARNGQHHLLGVGAPLCSRQVSFDTPFMPITLVFKDLMSLLAENRKTHQINENEIVFPLDVRLIHDCNDKDKVFL